MVHEHFKANLDPGSNNSFTPLYHVNFVTLCYFNTKTDKMQAFSLSVLINFFFSFFLVLFYSLKVQFCSNKQSEIFGKVSTEAL